MFKTIFSLATAADIVADPSAPDAFVDGIMEGKEWVWNNGILEEVHINKYKKGRQKSVNKKTERNKNQCSEISSLGSKNL